jgi:hypothetical protein
MTDLSFLSDTDATQAFDSPDRLIESWQEDPRRSVAGILLRLQGMVALPDRPGARYTHSDGSIWGRNGFFWASESPAECREFWYWVKTRSQNYDGGTADFAHGLDPYTGLRQRGRSESFDPNQEYPEALVIADRRSHDAALLNGVSLSRDRFYDDDQSIEDHLASGADPDALINAGILAL